jgi:hypothetical protein
MAVFAYMGKSLQAAQAYPMPLISVMILYGGFLISPGKWVET